jgi:hypothetical protein
MSIPKTLERELLVPYISHIDNTRGNDRWQMNVGLYEHRTSNKLNAA